MKCRFVCHKVVIRSQLTTYFKLAPKSIYVGYASCFSLYNLFSLYSQRDCLSNFKMYFLRMGNERAYGYKFMRY